MQRAFLCSREAAELKQYPFCNGDSHNNIGFYVLFYCIKNFNQHADKENLLQNFFLRFNEKSRVVFPLCLLEITSQLFFPPRSGLGL